MAATSGRGFWILDDLGALQNKSRLDKTVEIVKPKATYRIFGGTSKAVGQGQNPKSGVTFDYYLEKNIDSLPLTLEVLQNSQVIRTYTNKKVTNFKIVAWWPF